MRSKGSHLEMLGVFLLLWAVIAPWAIAVFINAYFLDSETPYNMSIGLGSAIYFPFLVLHGALACYILYIAEKLKHIKPH